MKKTSKKQFRTPTKKVRGEFGNERTGISSLKKEKRVGTPQTEKKEQSPFSLWGRDLLASSKEEKKVRKQPFPPGRWASKGKLEQGVGGRGGGRHGEKDWGDIDIARRDLNADWKKGGSPEKGL